MTARQLRIRTAARFTTLTTLVAVFLILPFLAVASITKAVGL